MFFLENGVTKWIGVNTQYLTQITATTTNAQGSTVTSTQQVQATIVGDPPVNGVLGADLSVIVTPEFLSEVNSIKAEFCPIKKRALTCGIGFVDKVAASFDIYAAADAAKWGTAIVAGKIIGGLLSPFHEKFCGLRLFHDSRNIHITSYKFVTK
jgi:hypothetical protein